MSSKYASYCYCSGTWYIFTTIKRIAHSVSRKMKRQLEKEHQVAIIFSELIFAGINFRTFGFTKAFAGINFRECDRHRYWPIQMNFSFALQNTFSLILIYGFDNDLTKNLYFFN